MTYTDRKLNIKFKTDNKDITIIFNEKSFVTADDAVTDENINIINISFKRLSGMDLNDCDSVELIPFII